MTRQIPLYAMAHARSGDKGDGSNVGVLAYDETNLAVSDGIAGKFVLALGCWQHQRIDLEFELVLEFAHFINF